MINLIQLFLEFLQLKKGDWKKIASIFLIFFIFLPTSVSSYFLMKQNEKLDKKIAEIEKKEIDRQNGIRNILGILASQCNKGQAEKCYASRFMIGGISQQFVNSKLFMLITCRYSPKGAEYCFDSAMNYAKYGESLVIKKSLYDEVSRNNPPCDSSDKETLIVKGGGNIETFLAKLDPQLDNFTYCVEDDKFTVLGQIRGHNPRAIRGIGCKNKDCLNEMKTAHEMLNFF